MMDSKEITHYAQQIEKLHRAGNYDSVLSLLKTFEGVDITLEQLRQSGIAKVLFQVLKSSPVALLKKTIKFIFSNWKKQYGDSRRILENDCNQKKGLGEKCSGTTVANSRDGAPSILKEIKDDCKVTGDNASAVSEKSERHLVSSPTLERVEAAEESETPASLEQISEDQCGNSFTTSVTPASHNKCSTPVRSKSSELIFQALVQNEMETEALKSTARLRELACEIEEEIFFLHGQNDHRYKACVRSKVLNLRNPKNPDLLLGLRCGELSPQIFARMSVLEMASREMKELRAAYTESGIRQHQLPQPLEGTSTSKVRCRRCEGFDCSVTLIPRGTLFLPAWVRSASQDGDMLTFMTCKGCGEQWYHSGWVCL